MVLIIGCLVELSSVRFIPNPDLASILWATLGPYLVDGA